MVLDVCNSVIRVLFSIGLFLLCICILPAAAEPVAFPGAEGFGAISQGGRGGKVIKVTNLNDSGPGSFRAAVEQKGIRTVVFEVGGTIPVRSSINIKDPFITIAGQTAPGGGIALRNDGNTSATLKIQTHDVIIRFLRIRPGPGGNADGLALSTGEAGRIIIDHCSLTWGVDETVSMYTGDVNKKIKDVTFQWSIISDALDCSTHEEGCHSKGLLIQYADRVTVHHNLFANNGARSPMILSGDIEVSNNVTYNWGGSAVKIENRHGDVNLNHVANYFETGVDSDVTENGIQVKTPGITMFLKDNYANHVRPNNSYPEDAIVNYREQATLMKRRFDFPELTLTSAQQAYEDVLKQAGATLPQRDRVDNDIVAKVRAKTSRLVDDPSDVGGYPNLAAGSAPKDSDNDGMPDSWEEQYGFDKNDASDRNNDSDGDGYTNLEEYLNDITPGTESVDVGSTMGITLLERYWRIENVGTQGWVRSQNCATNTDSSVPFAQVSKNYDGDCTMYRFVPAEDDYYYIEPKKTAGRLTVEGCSTADKETVALTLVSNKNSGNCVQWKLNREGSQDHYRLQNRATGKYFRPMGCDDLLYDDTVKIVQVPTSYMGNCTLWSLVDSGSLVR